MFKRETIVVSCILGTAIPLVALIGQLIGFTDLWPAFFAVLLFFVGKNTDMNELKSTFCGGLTGIATSWVLFWMIGLIAPHTGFLPALIGSLVATCFFYALLRDVSSTLFNDYGFVYYLVASLFPEQKTLMWMGATVVGGAVFALLVFGAARIFMKPPQG